MPSDTVLAGSPVLVEPGGEGKPLERVPLTSGSLGQFNEAWLQGLIHANPACLPISEIEPGLGRFVPICRELPTPHGPIDNLLMTPAGEIALVETKLFRNPEARRLVLAQVLDYAMAVFRMDFASFEKAALRGQFSPATKPTSLYAFLSGPEQLPEEAFVDAVAKNLRRGRALVMIVGDGIRSEAEILLGDLHRFARFEFTLALIELAVFRMPESNRLLIRPRTLAKTEVVRRFVLGSGQEASGIGQGPPASEKVETLSSEAYWSALRSSVPDARPALERLIETVEPIGVFAEFPNSLNLKWSRPAGGTPVNLGYITKAGILSTEGASWWVPKDMARQYIEEVASALGCDAHRVPNRDEWSLYRNGKTARISDVIDRLQAWVPAIQRFITAITRHDASGV
jgi:hypothetical protein